jgi:hypothetical protein
MALEQITFNIGAFNDSDAGGNNYFTNTVFEVKNQSDNTFATIYADASGTTQIPQNGIDNISNSRGECNFYIDDGDFYLEVDSQQKKFNIGNFKTDFANIDEVKAYPKLSKLIGQRITTGEYHSGTGIGGASYDVVSSGGVTPNGIDIIQGVADSSAAIVLDTSKGVRVDMLGCKGEQTQLVADIFERGAEIVRSQGGGNLIINNGRHSIERTVFIPVGVFLKGESPAFNIGTTSEPDFNKSTVIYPVSGGSYVENFLFFLNIDINDPTDWVAQFPNKGSGGASDLSIDAYGFTQGYNAFKFGGSHQFSNIRCRGVGTLVRKPIDLYTDAVSIKQVHASYRNNDQDYLLDLLGLGDAYEIEDIASGYLDNQAGVTGNLRLGTCRSGHVNGLINGFSLFTGTSGVTVSAGHLEGGWYDIENAEVIVRGNVFFTEQENAKSGVYINNNDGFLNKWVSIVADNQFTRVPNRRGGWGNSERADITFENTSSVAIIENNYRAPSISGQISTKSTFGSLISLNGNLENLYNRYSEHLSTQSVKVSGGQVHLHHTLPPNNRNYGGISNSSFISSISQTTFKDQTGTYYYQCQKIIDKQRLIGGTVVNSPVSLTVNSEDDIPTILLDRGNFNDFSGIKLRFYRGTSSGQYDKYVDIPIINASKLYDDGESLYGFPWLDRPTSGIDTMNNNGLSGSIILKGENIEIDTDAAKPDAGSWIRGDAVKRVNLSPVGSGGLITTEYYRMTTGSGHVSKTDWLPLGKTEV